MRWISFLEDRAADCSEKVALISQNKVIFGTDQKSLNYFELNSLVNRLARKFKTLGVKKGERVTYLSTNRVEHLTFFLACAKLGAIFIPLNFRLSQLELKEICERISPILALGHGEANYIDQNCYLDLENDQMVLDVNDDNLIIESNLSDPLLMLFTSGSTGGPKGVLFHGEMLLANQEATAKNWGLLPDDKTLVETPFFHTGGYNVLCLPLMLLGGCSVIAEKFDVDNFYQTLENEKLSVYFGVPTMFQMIGENEKFSKSEFKSLRFLISGGAAIPVNIIKQFSDRGMVFKQGFGLTEIGPNCFLLDEKDAIRKLGSIGRPMPHSEVLVITPEGHKAQANIAGELLIKGPHLCAGYFREDEKFRESLHDGYFKTGDTVIYDEEGFFYVVGRIKDMYISGGENVYPAEVEKVLKTHQDIMDAVVVAVPSDKWGEVGLAFIRSSREFSLDELRGFLADKLSRYKHPAFIEFKKEFPLLGSGKIDRNLLKQTALKLNK